MSKFKLPKPRFDRKIANEGCEVAAIDENGTYWGTYRLALVDQTLPRYRVTLERLQRKYQPNKGKRPDAEAGVSIAAEIAVEMAILDWSDVGEWREENGPDVSKDGWVKFSKARAIELLSLAEVDEETGETYYPTAWLLSFLSREAENLRNFQPIEQTDAPEKN